MLFNIVMPRVGSRDYVSDTDCFCMYKIMVGEKMNLLEIIFFYWMQAFKEKFSPKVKKNYIPQAMLFIQILRLVGMDVSSLEPSSGITQLKVATFVKMGIT